MLKDVSLSDRFNIKKSRVLLSGTQALIRATIMQSARDEAENIDSGGFVTGYRGSPLGGVDQQFQMAEKEIEAYRVKFQPSLNEDSAATALWGSQQINLRDDGLHKGVFGLWYGKGPGIDRSGDVFRHANLAGTAQYGGVLVAMGDDHTGESSTTLHQSEYALMDSMMPILSPAGVQEILDFSLIGWALSRYSGLWVGLKCVKDTVEVTEVVDGNLEKVRIQYPKKVVPSDEVSIRKNDLPIEQEERLHNVKLPAALDFVRSNGVDRIHFPNKNAEIGIISAGKSWLDTQHALSILGISEEKASELGISTYKIGMVWPVEPSNLLSWSKGLKLIIVVEEKRKLIEGQVRNILYNLDDRPIVIGGKNEYGKPLFQSHYALDPQIIANGLGERILLETDCKSLQKNLMELKSSMFLETNSPVMSRTPYFCAGCPHNSSTKIPKGSRAYAGIGCHYMVQWMERSTEGYTHMGGEGANWIGEGLFSSRKHIFQNMGDGTYNHSGLMSIRAAVASNSNITYKILFNDAVAMTGGQKNDGNLTPVEIIKELIAMGVKEVVGVYDEKEEIDSLEIKRLIKVVPREHLVEVQEKLAKIKGVSALVYIQTCAAEKRRRRKRGEFPDPDKRVFINSEVCEGCGDCGLQSNCVAILPKNTELGLKRKIDQSSCNKDFSCLNGLCPSFVEVHGASLNKKIGKSFAFPNVPDPEIPEINQTFNIVVAGVGGTGVVTIGALIAMAAHLEDKGAGIMEMAGLAQKGGAVHIHCRIAKNSDAITAIRLSNGEADALIGCELMVSAGEKTLALLKRDHTRGVCNSFEANSGEFTLDSKFSLPTDDMRLALTAKLGEKNIYFYDSVAIAKNFLGDGIYANVLMLGSAWQNGLIPLSRKSIEKAIQINGAGVDGNLAAFKLGCWIAHDMHSVKEMMESGTHKDLIKNDFNSIFEFRAKRLVEYQNLKLAKKYRVLVNTAKEKNIEFGLAVAKGYFKLLAYKDEYEVARLHSKYLKTFLKSEFLSYRKISFSMSPPLLARKLQDGRTKKVTFGAWMLTILRLLAKGKILRGSVLDIFGYSKERRCERELISEYEKDIQQLIVAYSETVHRLVIDRALLPLKINGFGVVKERAVLECEIERQKLMIAVKNPDPEKHLVAAE